MLLSPSREIDSNPGFMADVIEEIERFSQEVKASSGLGILKGGDGSFLEELRRSEERYRLAVNASNEGIWDWDILKDVTFWNDRFYQMLGLTRESDASRKESFWELVHPEDCYEVFKRFMAHLRHDEIYEVEFRIRHAEGNYLHCFSRARAQRNEKGHAIRMAGMVSDITQRKEMELQLAQAKTVAENANQKKNQFLANMSHELRTPLNAIIGFADMLESNQVDNSPEKQKKYAHYISVSGRHLLNLVNDILDISKIEVGHLEVAYKQIELLPFLEELEAYIMEFAEKRQVAVFFECSQDCEYVDADPARLRQIYLNLLNNAIKFNRAGGSVWLRLSRDGDWLVSEVQDTGIGIPAESVPMLFKEFYQVDSSFSRKEEGVGLGLTLTQQLIELHSGTLSVDSVLHEGTTFTFRIPCTKPPA